MIMSGKTFDLSSLILKKMMATLEKSVSGIPYGLLLTRVFEFYKVYFKTATRMVVKEALDQRAFIQNNLQIEDGVVSRILISPPLLDTPITDPATSAEPISVAPTLVSQSIHADIAITSSELISLRSVTQAIQNDLLAVKAEYQTIKGAMKDFISEIKIVKEFMLKSAGMTSTTHSAMEDDLGLEGLADAAAKDGEDLDTEATKTDGDDGNTTPKDS